MKIYTSKYRHHWVSPYTILEKVFFWREIDYDEPIIDKLSNILNPFCTAWMKFLDFVHPRINYIKIDYWDVWNMDSTLSPIILPMLKQLKEVKHGSPFVDFDDVPEHMRTSDKVDYDYEQKCFDFYKEETDELFEKKSKEWDIVLDKMIWSFQQIAHGDYDDKYHHGTPDYDWVETDTQYPNPITGKMEPTYQMVDKNPDEHWYDVEGHELHETRMREGFELFGKYFRNLWD